MLGESCEALHWLTTATGGSCIKAIEVLLEQGCKEEKILFINLVSHLEEGS